MRRIVCEECSVRENSVAGGLPTALLGGFRACLTTTLYRPRQPLFREGAPADGLYILCHGTVRLYQSDPFGHEYVLAVAGPGEVLGEIGMGNGETYSALAEAMVECQASFLPREALARFLQLHPTAGLRLVARLGSALAQARRTARDLAFKSAEERLAELLLQLADGAAAKTAEGEICLTLAYSRREIAEMIGVAPETVMRLLADLRDRHVLSLAHRDVTVHDVAQLRRIARHGDAAG